MGVVQVFGERPRAWRMTAQEEGAKVLLFFFCRLSQATAGDLCAKDGVVLSIRTLDAKNSPKSNKQRLLHFRDIGVSRIEPTAGNSILIS